MIRRLYTSIANNYSSLPVNIIKGKDIYLWDIHHKKYIDLLAGYSAVNQGHCHSKLVSIMQNQCKTLTLTSRVVTNNNLIQWSDYITKLFKYDKVLAMNSGAEAVETSLKLARRYGHDVMNIPENKAKIVCLSGNFHGRTIGTISLSDYPNYKKGFGSLLDNILTVKMNDCSSLFQVFEKNANEISAIIYEPIQGEGGIIPISNDFFKALYQIKQTYPNILLMADEIQSGLGRSGNWTAGQVLFPEIKPDVLILGKALSGGMIPMSCVLANTNQMNVFDPGSHGSTFGGNPLACAISIEALNIIDTECMDLIKKKEHIMKIFLHKMLIDNPDKIVDVRGCGMFWGIQFNENYNIEKLRYRLLDLGYITCTARNNTLRITPPLTISYKQIEKCMSILGETI
jgi:ornithine--oxo-acid transaminase